MIIGPLELLTRLDEAAAAVTVAREAVHAATSPPKGVHGTAPAAVIARICEPDAVTLVALAIDDPRAALGIAPGTIVTPAVRAHAAIAAVTDLITMMVISGGPR